jgi:lipoate synthase
VRKNWRVFLSKSFLPRRLPRKPDWIRVKISNPNEIQRIKGVLREQKLHTVCEEAACPNLPECFGVVQPPL